MKTVNKVIDVLEVFLGGKDEASIGELADLSGLHNGTIHRICSTLAKRGYLYQKKKRGKYSAGLAFLRFQNANMFALEIKETALPYLTELSKLACESVNLALWDGSAAVEAAEIVTDRILQATSIKGYRMPPNCTCTGKLLLAYKSDRIIESILKREKLLAYTEHTMTDYRQLKKELANIRQEGIAFDDEETELGLRAIAAPIRDSN
jgi:IclR family KDG regulon transcriptional repressor